MAKFASSTVKAKRPNLIEDQAAWKKKSNSDISDSSRKADHKHVYESCLLFDWRTSHGVTVKHHHLGVRCTMCGKMHVTHYFLFRRDGELGHRVILSEKEMLEEYSDLPKYSLV